MGGETIDEAALIHRSGTLFCATFEPRTAVRIGDQVEVAVAVERLHFFDPESEVAISA
jgi:multiple sugar transport system ATP-binding protein